MDLETLTFEVRDHVAHITLNRPDNANAMNIEMARDLMLASIECDENPDIRAVLITGTGKMFSAGGDLKGFAASGDRIRHVVKEMTVYLHAGVSRFTRMDAPVIMAVNGTAAGAGFSLAICGDLVLAARSAKFTMAYTAAALSPDGSSTYFLPRLVGLRRAQELMITNRRLSAEEALDWGLVTAVHDDDALHAEAAALAKTLAAGPTRAFGAVKSMLVETFTTDCEAQMERESRFIADMMGTRDAQHGIESFIAKQKPEYEGR
ncbi:MAG: enoyl-CoA hydratase/isomerase family protein [Pseudomonadota bacterium]